MCGGREVRETFDADLMRLGRNVDFERAIVAAPTNATSMRVWYCGVRSFEFLKRFPKLRVLFVAGWSDSDLSALAYLTELRRLKIVHLPKVTSLTTLPVLPRLEEVSLSILASEDPKLRPIESWDPLCRLPSLKMAYLHGLQPARGGILSFAKAPKLRTLWIDDIYPLRDLIALRVLRPKLRGPRREPIELFTMSHGDKCTGVSVLLNGLYKTGKKRWVCSVCDAALVEQHKKLWDTMIKAKRAEMRAKVRSK
jgi:hypothetical protein